MKKCALIWLPFNEPSMPPLGIATLTGYLRRKGFSVHPFDLNVEFYAEMKFFFKHQPQKIVNMFNSWAYNAMFQQAASSLAFPDMVSQPAFLLWEKRSVYVNLESFLLSATERIIPQFDIVGISVTNVSYMVSVALSRMIKSVSPETFIVWGGPSISSEHCLEKLNQLDCVDLLISGPGEAPLEGILTQVTQGKEVSEFNCKHISNNQGQPKSKSPDSEKRLCQKTTHKEACPDFSSFPIQLYDHLTFPIQTSTGCPWSKCAFCSEAGLSHHVMPLEHTDQCIDQISLVSEKGSIFFVDSCINWNLKRLDKICNLFESKGPKKWTCMARSERLTPPILRKMKSAGCERVFIGLESFSDSTLDAMQKGSSKLDHLHAFRLGQELGIQLAGNFIIGFPGETAKDILENIHVLERYAHLWLNCLFWLSPYAITPGSKIFQKPEDYELLIHGHGDETQGLPETVSRYVPVWNHHWTYQEKEKNNDKKILQLYHQLDTCIQSIQEKPKPKRYVKKTWKGLAVCEENRNGRAVKPVVLSRFEGTILKFTSEITSFNCLKNETGLDSGRLSPLLQKMEHSGWIAQSKNRVVRTIPFKGIKI